MLRYLRLIFVPSVMNLSKKQPKAQDQINASKVCCDCNCTESFSHSTLKNASSSRVKMNEPDTITSTLLCGPRLCTEISTKREISFHTKISTNWILLREKWVDRIPWDRSVHLAKFWYCELYSSESVAIRISLLAATMLSAKIVWHTKNVAWTYVQRPPTGRRIKMSVRIGAENRRTAPFFAKLHLQVPIAMFARMKMRFSRAAERAYLENWSHSIRMSWLQPESEW